MYFEEENNSNNNNEEPMSVMPKGSIASDNKGDDFDDTEISLVERGGSSFSVTESNK